MKRSEPPAGWAPAPGALARLKAAMREATATLPARRPANTTTRELLPVEALWRLPDEARSQRDATCAAERPRETRIAWWHCPKCGSSFATTLYHLANASLPEHAQLPHCTHLTRLLLKPEIPRNLTVSCKPGVCAHSPSVCALQRNRTTCTRERCFMGQPELTFHLRFPLDSWFKCTFWEKWHGNFGGHEPIDALTYERFRGRFFGMFRQPHARIASAYLYFSSEFASSALPSPQR